MTKDNFKVHIPAPCSEDWKAMPLVNEGRYCGSCQQTVVDFTSMSTDQIKEYFERHKHKKICGHFHVSQTTTHSSYISEVLSKIYRYMDTSFTVPVLKKFALFLVSMSMIIAGCKKTVGERQLPQDCNDPSGKDKRITGDTILRQEVDTSIRMGKPLPRPER